jgi:hypothetical protein
MSWRNGDQRGISGGQRKMASVAIWHQQWQYRRISQLKQENLAKMAAA